MNIRYIFACVLLFVLSQTQAYGQFVIQKVDSLRENACAIVDNYSAVFSQTDLNNATLSVSKVITILNEQGEEYGYFNETYDKFRELKDFSGVIKNMSGTVVKKIGKKNLISSSLSEHLSTDDYSMFYEYKNPTYPYTIEYTYQERWKNGILYYPPFIPMNGSLLSLKQASYKIELPTGMNLRYYSNYSCNIKDETVGNKHIYSLSLENMKAIDREPYAPPFREIIPKVLLMPNDFCYDSTCGNLSNWENHGKWISSLLTGKDILPADFVIKIKDLTKDAKNDREKVAILYQYLQNNTRYVSIQLGIGGYQPIDATSVSKSGFGDCKGLTNLMMAMLKAVDIPSNYSIVSMREKDILPDFPNFNQFDHVILLVPFKNDSIWLECTSQKLPFGYIHDKIAGHNSLIITNEGGKMCRLPEYKDDQNYQVSKLDIDISENGMAKGKMQFTEHLHLYDKFSYWMISKDREKEMNYINTNVNMPKIKISQIEVSEDRSSLPSCTLSANFEAEDFVNKTGMRLFASVCPLRKGNYNIFTSSTRKQDIVIENGYSDSDSITFNIPETYAIESLPKDISIETPFGKLKTQCKVEDRKIIYIQNIDIFTGKYDKSSYNEIKSFFSEINSAIKRKLVLKKI